MAEKKALGSNKTEGAPNSLMGSLFVGLIFFPLLVIFESLKDIPNYLTTYAALAFVGLELAICFYWRRIRPSSTKNNLGILLQLSHWLTMFGIVITELANQALHPNLDIIKPVALFGLLSVSVISFAFSVVWAGQSGKGSRGRTFAISSSLVTFVGLLSLSSYLLFKTSIHASGSVKLSAKSPILHDSASAHNDHDSHSSPAHGDSSKKELAHASQGEHLGVVENHGSSAASDHIASDHAQKAHVAPDAHAKSSHAAPHWSYTGSEGPDFWASLDANFQTCKSGKSQSPIDISKKSKLNALGKINYNKSTLTVENNGHTIQANFNSGNSILLNGQPYALLQFHYHSPAEHTLNGVSYPVELHFVHKNDKGELAVLGVFVEAGERNVEMDKVLNLAPSSKGSMPSLSDVLIDLNNILPQNKSVFQYNGSLTTPPCSEGVKWNVFANVITLQSDQIAALKRLFQNNNRPIQNLNSRNFSHENAH